MRHIHGATLNTLRGLRQAAKTESAFRKEAALLAAGIPLGLVIAPDVGWYVAMIGVLLVTLAVELLNTAVEKLADHVAPERHPAIGTVKDFGSAAVFCLLLCCGLIWGAAAGIRFGLL
jgi:diacylglycerol kinase (ATP)